MRKLLVLKSSQLRRGEIQNVMLRMGEATMLLTLPENGLGAARVLDFKASVDTLTSALRKNRSTKAMSDALKLSDVNNKRFVSLIIKIVSTNVVSFNETVSQAAKQVLQEMAVKGNFFVGTREYRYSVLDTFIFALENLGNDVLKQAGIAEIFEALKNGREEFFSIWKQRSDFKETIVKEEVKSAVDNALLAYNELVEWINGKVAFEGSDVGVAKFISSANQIITEMNGKIALRNANGVISNQEVDMTDC